jgi:Protein of unknown function (DUF664)
MAEVERNWFRRVLTGEQVPPIYDPQADPHGQDGGFDLHEDISFQTAKTTWENEIAVSRANCADRDLTQTSAFMGGEVTLRWIYTHMIAEYAHHKWSCRSHPGTRRQYDRRVTRSGDVGVALERFAEGGESTPAVLAVRARKRR